MFTGTKTPFPPDAKKYEDIFPHGHTNAHTQALVSEEHAASSAKEQEVEAAKSQVASLEQQLEDAQASRAEAAARVEELSEQVGLLQEEARSSAGREEALAEKAALEEELEAAQVNRPHITAGRADSTRELMRAALAILARSPRPWSVSSCSGWEG